MQVISTSKNIHQKSTNKGSEMGQPGNKMTETFDSNHISPLKPTNFNAREQDINVAITNYSDHQIQGMKSSGRFQTIGVNYMNDLNETNSGSKEVSSSI